MSRTTDPALEIALEQVYEHETSITNWDSSFIESIRDQYYTKGGLTDRQKEIVLQRYARLNDHSSQQRCK